MHESSDGRSTCGVQQAHRHPPELLTITWLLSITTTATATAATASVSPTALLNVPAAPKPYLSWPLLLSVLSPLT